MKKSYFASAASTFIFLGINIFIDLCLALTIGLSIRKYGEFRLDMAWMLLFSMIFFIIIINAHFAYLGMFSRVVLTDDKISLYKIVRTEKEIYWANIKNIEVVKEMKTYNKSGEAPVILITGYDSEKKNQVVIKVDYKERIHNNINEFLNRSRKRAQAKINKYFEES